MFFPPPPTDATYSPKNTVFSSGPLTLSSTISMEKSFPSPRELLHVLMLLLLVMRARIVHLSHTSNTEDDELISVFFFPATQLLHHPELGNMND